MKATNEEETDATERRSTWRSLIPLLSAAAFGGDPVARSDLKWLADMGDAFPELLCTLELVLNNGHGPESATAPDAPWWLRHGWAVLAKANGVGRRPAHSN